MIRSAFPAAALAALLLLSALPLHAESPVDTAPRSTPADPLAAFRTPRPGLLTGGQPDATAWPAPAARRVPTASNLRPQAGRGGWCIALPATGSARCWRWRCSATAG